MSMDATRLESAAPGASGATAGRLDTGHDDRRWLRAFEPPEREHGFEWLEVEGRVPPELRATLYFNGPVTFERFGQPYGHWFDGDGGVAAVRLRPGRAHGAYRTLDTRGRRIEQLAGRPLFASFDTRFFAPLVLLHPSWRIKNSANTAILCHAGRVYALFEGGKPTAIDPWTLQTLGEDDLDGVVRTGYTAHPTRLPDGRVYGYGLRIGKDDFLDLFETRDGRTRALGSLPLSQPTMVHDFAATDRHLIFFLSPLILDKVGYLLGRGSFAECLRFEPDRGTEIVIVPIDAPERPTRFTVEPFFQWHFANAFERGGELIVDFVRYADFANNAWLRSVPRGRQGESPGGQLCRAVIDPERRRARFEPTGFVCEFPVVHSALRGAPTRFVYVGTDARQRMSRPMDRLAKVDLDSGATEPFDLGPDTFPSEPVFVPRPGGSAEDDGWLASFVYDAGRHRSFLALLDPRRPSEGPLAKVWFEQHVPPRFHGDVA